MENKEGTTIDICRIIVMWIATAVNTLFGSTDGLFLTLLIFMSADYITGVCVGIVKKKLSSYIGAKGIAKKVGILCTVSVATLIEQNIIGISALRDVVILYYISNEGISIIENITKIGVPIPKKLKDVIKNMTSDDS